MRLFDRMISSENPSQLFGIMLYLVRAEISIARA